MNRRNMVAMGVLLVLGAGYEFLYVIGVLPFSILAPAWWFTPQTMPPLVALTLVAAAWLILKGMRGFGDMALASDAIITPGRTVRQVLRGVPGLLPLDRVSAIRLLTKPSPARLEIRCRTNSGQERRITIPLASVPDPNEFLSELNRRGIPVSTDS